MERFSSEQEAQNIISLFGGHILNPQDFGNEVLEDEISFEQSLAGKEDIFSPKIQSEEVSLEMGFMIVANQMSEFRKKLLKTQFYLTDLENLLT